MNTAAPVYNGNTLLGKTEWLLGKVGVIFATLFAAPERFCQGSWDTQCYRDSQEACRLASTQLDIYHRLADEQSVFRLIGSRGDLDLVLGTWRADRDLKDRTIGLIPLMEGADPVLEPARVEEWFERGVRIMGLSWASASRYAGGNREPGPLTGPGRHLLEVMADFDMILDLSHLAEQAYYQALDTYQGVTIASHSNPRRFCPSERGLSDEMIALLAARNGVIGLVPYNVFLKPGWRRGDNRGEVSLEVLADAIDHVCQVTGSDQHVGLGTDFDGGFGVEHTPFEIDTIADLQVLGSVLAARGYTQEQIKGFMGGNWLKVLRQALPH